jgi:hypothetical protein
VYVAHSASLRPCVSGRPIRLTHAMKLAESMVRNNGIGFLRSLCCLASTCLHLYGATHPVPTVQRADLPRIITRPDTELAPVGTPTNTPTPHLNVMIRIRSVRVLNSCVINFLMLYLLNWNASV